ncbi:endonuclease/exonuclease/phosphatase family protein [Carboxylicivirga sp. N1Y90]|uniref:endonuclease/exonuclease/phosphatase family protein n=1 Tax=Carboxylicivirga fragile TaxID=3417571 RepID=UPI003D350822|nr:endonuclease/exonuclease/phosphatase family protein [Marinilabiliaceae bacterium N1Y90]
MRRFFRSIITLISLVASGFLMLSVLTAYVNPSRMWVLAFLGFGFPILWGVNVLLVLLWASKRRWQLLIPLLAILLTWGHWNNTFQWKGKRLKESQQLEMPLSVMSFNVRMWDIYNWTGEKNVQNKIFEMIRKENPDVLCLQEFYSSTSKSRYSEHSILARLNQYKYKHIEYRAGKRGRRNFGLVTLSKYPIVEKGNLKFEHTSNFSIHTDIKVHGKRVRVFNNHLESIRFSSKHLNFLDSLNFKNEDERRAGIREITGKMRVAFEHRADQAERIGRHISNSPFPAIVCGDFNDTPVSYVYREMRGELKDAFVESGSGMGGTYNGKLPAFRIDFIFHDQRFQAYDFKKLDVNYSDHFPIVTIIDLSEEVKK